MAHRGLPTRKGHKTMTTQQPVAPVERITYGNLRPPRRPGVLGMGMAASVLVGVAAVIVVIILMGFGLIAAGVAFLVAVVVLTPMIAHGPDGHSGYQRLLGRVVFRSAAKAGRNVYLAGATGQTPDGRTRLPGLLAQSEVVEAVDAYGDAYGVIVTPGVDHYSVTMQSEASGNDLVDQSVTDSAVAHWGGWHRPRRPRRRPHRLGAHRTAARPPSPHRSRRVLPHRRRRTATSHRHPTVTRTAVPTRSRRVEIRPRTPRPATPRPHLSNASTTPSSIRPPRRQENKQ